jgi:hypothetical protein
LKQLFPHVNISDLAIHAKFGLLFRGTAALETLFPEAVICDRGLLFARHRKRYFQILYEWCQFAGLGEAFEARDMTEVRGVLATPRVARRDSEWELFSTMPSTAFVSSVFRTFSALHSTMLELSWFGSLGARVGSLAITGALFTSYNKSRFCTCGLKFTFSCFLSCVVLAGPCRVQSLCFAVEREDWREAASVILSGFEVYLHLIRGGELRGDES